MQMILVQFTHCMCEVISMNKNIYLILAILNSSILFADATEHETSSVKVISDEDEYADFVEARDMKDGLQKAARMEAFVREHPESVLAVNALEHALVAYQQAGLHDKVEQTAEDILEMERNNLVVLSTLTYIQRVKATKGDPDAIREAQENGKRGLRALLSWKRPEALSEAEYERQRTQMTAIFAGAAAYGAQKDSDFVSARMYYLIAVKAAPDSMADYYQLAVACLDMAVPDVNGFWYLARAYYLAGEQQNTALQQKIAKNGKARYRKYHGSEDGWDQLLAAAVQQTEPPEGFFVTSLSPCELAVKLVQETDALQLTFADWKLALSQRDCSSDAALAAQKVWQHILDKQQNNASRLVIPAKVLSVSGTTITAAVTREGRHENKGELLATFTAHPKNMPALYADVDIVGIISDYTAEPFLLKMKATEVR